MSCGGDERDWVIDPARIHAHVGHDIEIVTYANQNLAIECVSCGMVLADIDFWEAESPGAYSQRPSLTQAWRSRT